MSVAEVSREPAPGPGLGGLIVRWLPPLMLLLAVVGLIAVLPTVNSDQSSREWYRNQVGGSELYRLNVIFARVVPFLAGAFIAIAILQRRLLTGAEVNTAQSLTRHGVTEVLTHWLNAAGVIICLITALWLTDWISNPLALRTAYIVHFIGAGFIVSAVAHHLTYQYVGGGRGLLPRSKADVKNAIAETVSYTGVYRGLPGAFGLQMPLAVRRKVQPLLRRLNLAPDPNDKYLATERVISYSGWGILVGVVVVTGLIKALNYIYGFPGWIRQWASFLHDGALLFMLAMLAMHVAALVLVPRNWGLLKSMFTTRVSRAYAKEHLPLWEEAVERSEGQEQPGA